MTKRTRLRPPTTLERFLSKITISKNSFKGTSCWDWIASITPNGYGKFWFGNKHSSSHRFSYLFWNGKLDDSLTIDHLCRNTKCCNPKHLDQVTQKENIQRGNTGKVPRSKRKLNTHCIRDHEFTEENTYVKSTGARGCRMCGRLRARTIRDSPQYLAKQLLKAEIIT